MKHIGTKRLETERLILRRLTKDDAYTAYNNWCTSEEVTKYIWWYPHKNVEETINLYSMWEDEYKEPDTYRWIVEIKDTHDLIGTIDVVSKEFLSSGTCEIGYCYGERYWGKGYAAEALKAVIKFLFEECDAELIQAKHMSNNPNSGLVMQKAGMSYDATLRSRVLDKMGNRNDLVYRSITKGEYFNQK